MQDLERSPVPQEPGDPSAQDIPSVLQSRARRKRSRFACDMCHYRKVRCDVALSDLPCTNCRLDNHHCSIRISRKRGRKCKPSVQAPDGSSSAATDHASVAQEPKPAIGHQRGSSWEAGPEHNPGETTQRLEGIKPLPGSLNTGDFTGSDAYVSFYYYKFLKIGELHNLRPNQVRYLELKGCLQVPSGSVLDEFMRQYFLYIHPCMPILNEGRFWSSYLHHGNDHGNDHAISLCLFQAMLFAASRFVSMDVIRACGFQSLQRARAAFHQRAELLLNHHSERDSVALAQASLLLSFQSTMRDQNLNSLWLSTAIEHAKAADAQFYYRDPFSSKSHILEKKRLWWCCILRDRMIALGVRRCIQITSDDFDFEQECLTESDLADEVDKSEVYDAKTKRLLAKIAIVQCQLAIAMTSVMISVYPTCGSPVYANSTVSRLIPSMTQIERSKTELAVWARMSKFKLKPHSIEGSQSDVHESVTLYTDLTYLHYYSAQIALYNHLASILKRYQPHIDDYEHRFENLKHDLQRATTKITEKIIELTKRGLARHLPISAPSCTALPFVLQSLDLKLSSASQKPQCERQLSYYKEAMSLLSVQHDHTECVSTTIQKVLQVVDREFRRLHVASQHPPDDGSVERTRSYPPSSWGDIFVQNPIFYLRLSLSMDLSLSRGKYPEENELPGWIVGPSLSTKSSELSLTLSLLSPSTPYLPMPIINPAVLPRTNEEEEQQEEAPALNRFFNFDFLEPWTFPESEDVDCGINNLLGSFLNNTSPSSPILPDLSGQTRIPFQG